MAVLEYDFRVVGRAAVEREIAALEKRFIQSANKLTAHFEKMGGGRSSSRQGTSSISGSRAAQFQPGRNEQLRSIREEQRRVDSLNRSRQSLHNQRIREERAIRAEQQRTIDQTTRSQQALARQRKREEQENLRVARTRAEFVKSTVGGGVGRVANVLGSVGRAGIAVAGLGAGAIAASSISQAISLDEMARRTLIAGRQPGQAEATTPEDLVKSYSRTAIKYGVSQDAVAASTRAYVTKTGNMKEAMRLQDMFAEAGQGTESDPAAIAKTVADMQLLGITKDADIKKSLATFTHQGKLGKFELADLVTEAPQVLSTAASLGARGTESIRSIGAMLQMGNIATGSKEETGTSVRNLYLDLVKHSKDIQSGKIFGGKKVDVYEGGDPKKNMRDIGSIVMDMLSASRGNLGELLDASNIRGIKPQTALMSAYKEAYNTTKGSDKDKDIAGRKAAQAKFDEFKNVSDDYGEIQKDASAAMKSFSVQMEILNTKLQGVIASQLFPKLIELMPQFEKLIPIVGQLLQRFMAIVGWLAENPFKGLGYAVTAAIVYEFAKARLATVITSAMTSIFAGIQAGGLRGGLNAITPQTSGTTVAGALGAAGTGLAIGAVVGSAIYSSGVAKFEAGEASMTQGGAALNDVRNADVKDIERVKAQIAEQRKRAAAAHKTDFMDDVLDSGLGIFGSASNKTVEANTQDAFLEEMVAKLDKLEKAAAELNSASKNINNAKPNTSDKPTPIDKK